jgi:oligoribonuclease NrnB/cAMP/cGMP phosphodiesterase (DHH superfamily)
MSAHTVVIYHKSDFDGIFCREIALKFLGDDGVDYLGWEYGEPAPPILPDQQLYILDLSVDALMTHPKLIWIDHHKTAIDKYPATIPGYRIDGVAACRLAWQWFAAQQPGWKKFGDQQLPWKEAYINRMVSEPLAVRLAGEYDIWDKRDPNADLFQHGLRSQELTQNTWAIMLTNMAANSDGVHGSPDCGAMIVHTLLNAGKAIAYAKAQENESIIRKNGFTVQWEGLTFLACNASHYNSHLFTAGIQPQHEALLGFCLRANGKWSVSLYGVPHRPDVDLSGIAAKHGGGGHRQACGFTTDKLPFLN